MDSFRTLGVANKLLKVHAMQAQLDKLSAMDANLKLLGEVPIRPDRFRLHRSGQTGKFPTCFVQESQDNLALLPAVAYGPGYFKTLAKNIKARHASHAMLPINPDRLNIGYDSHTTICKWLQG